MQQESTPPNSIDSRHRKLAVAAGMASLLDSAAIISVGVGLALWRDHYDLDVWLVGVLGSALTLFIAVGALVGGRLADLFGRGRLFSVTILGYAVGALGVAFAPNAALLVTSVIVIGIAAGADLPTSLAVLSERVPAGAQGRLVAFTHVMWTLGVVLATLLGFAVSGLGVFGVRLIFIFLAALAVLTFAFRAFYPTFRELDDQAAATYAADGVDVTSAIPVRTLLTNPSFRATILLTTAFYLFFTLVANTFGQFKTYFLVTVSETTQTMATAVSFATTLVGLVFTVVFTRIADTKWRSRLFYVGVAVFTSCQLLIAATGGSVLAMMVAALVLYNISFPFVGEALYKIWTQESFPVNARATVQGATMAVARFAAAGFALITPALIDWSPSWLYVILAAFALTSGTVGAAIFRRQRQQGTVRFDDTPASTGSTAQ